MPHPKPFLHTITIQIAQNLNQGIDWHDSNEFDKILHVTKQLLFNSLHLIKKDLQKLI